MKRREFIALIGGGGSGVAAQSAGTAAGADGPSGKATGPERGPLIQVNE